MGGTYSVNFNDFQGIKTLGNSLKNGLTWLGHKIKIGFQKISPYLKTAALLAMNFLKTPLGLSLLGATASAILLAIANSSSLQGDLNKSARIAMKIVAVVLFVGVGVGIGFAILNGNAPFV